MELPHPPSEGSLKSICGKLRIRVHAPLRIMRSLLFVFANIPGTVYIEAMLTHLSILRKVWGAGSPATWIPREFLCVDSAPSCGHQNCELGRGCGHQVRRNPKHSPEKAVWEGPCSRDHVFRRDCQPSELGTALRNSFL